MNTSAGMRNEADYGSAGCGTLDLAHHLSEVEFRNHDALHLFGDSGNLLLGEWPRGNDAELADLQALVAGHLDGALRDPGSDAVGDDHDVSAVHAFFFEEHDVVDVLGDLL